jgi:hypothetical protein
MEKKIKKDNWYWYLLIITIYIFVYAFLISIFYIPELFNLEKEVGGETLQPQRIKSYEIGENVFLYAIIFYITWNYKPILLQEEHLLLLMVLCLIFAGYSIITFIFRLVLLSKLKKTQFDKYKKIKKIIPIIISTHPFMIGFILPIILSIIYSKYFSKT